MKLFQQLLVASATVGLIAPSVSQASDVINLDEISNYSSSIRFDQETFSNQVNVEVAENDEVDLQQNNFEAGSFSETTTLDGKTIFAVGALDNSSGDISEATMFNYTYQMNLNTSFSGDDNLYVRLKSGNTKKDRDPFGTSADGSYLSSTNTNGDVLKVDKIWYEFPLAEKHTVWIGPRIENYYMHGASPSIYSPTLKQFKLGGNGAAYGASTDKGVGWAYNGDNGFSVSSNIVSKGGASADTTVEDLTLADITAANILTLVEFDGTGADGELQAATNAQGAATGAVVNVGPLTATTTTPGTTAGILGDTAKTNWSTQVAYTTDRYHVSALVAMKYNDWEDSYYSTALGKARTDGSTNYGLRAYWRPEDSGTAVPEISVGYDTSTVVDQDADTNAYFVGLTWKDLFQASDKIGVAFGSPQTSTAEAEDPFTWEAYYSFKPNDSMEIRPTIFGYESARGTADRDYTAVVVETTFKF